MGKSALLRAVPTGLRLLVGRDDFIAVSVDSLACGFCVASAQSLPDDVGRFGVARCMVGGAMQRRYAGGIDDFAKFALLRHVMKHRRLAVCWYLTGENEER